MRLRVARGEREQRLVCALRLLGQGQRLGALGVSEEGGHVAGVLVERSPVRLQRVLVLLEAAVDAAQQRVVDGGVERDRRLEARVGVLECGWVRIDEMILPVLYK